MTATFRRGVLILGTSPKDGEVQSKVFRYPFRSKISIPKVFTRAKRRTSLSETRSVVILQLPLTI